jgi:hypothetical protein
MKWVVWRQHRIEFLIAVIVFILFTSAAVIAGRPLARSAANTEVNAFSGQPVSVSDPFFLPMQLLPLLLGIFIGAPIVAREVEMGTFRLTWTQGITRQRWLLIKLGLVGSISLVIFVLLDLLGNWLNQPLSAIMGPFPVFDGLGVVYIVYGLFALALGVAAGTLLGRTVPAMAVTILFFLVIRLGIEALRQNYLPPLQSAWNLAGAIPHSQDWVLNGFLANSAGSLISPNSIVQMCGIIPINPRSPDACLTAHGIQWVFVYQPAGRFWIFQGIESIIFLALIAGLVLLTFWWIKNRVE